MRERGVASPLRLDARALLERRKSEKRGILRRTASLANQQCRPPSGAQASTFFRDTGAKEDNASQWIPKALFERSSDQLGPPTAAHECTSDGPLQLDRCCCKCKCAPKLRRTPCMLSQSFIVFVAKLLDQDKVCPMTTMLFRIASVVLTRYDLQCLAILIPNAVLIVIVFSSWTLCEKRNSAEPVSAFPQHSSRWLSSS